jgi:GrpB-like predicted nucleotidyltransferase (UPF0157 family)
MSDKIFHIEPWTPTVVKVADSLTSRIHEAAPELEVLFMGAAALGLPGKNDIDLDVLCKIEDLTKYTNRLVSVLGEPKGRTDNLTAWEFVLEGFEVDDCILSDPATSHVPLQRNRFELLNDNPELLHEYKQLKESCDGMPYSEYEKRKIAFLEAKVLSSSSQ